MSTKEKNYRRHGKRYRARRRAVDIIFEAEARDIDPVGIVDERAEMARQPESSVAPIAEYTREMVLGTATMLDEIDEQITRFLSDDWELDRLPAVDRAILRVLGWEILYNPEVDAPISVVEGVEIASEYSTDSGAPYIHAVLDDIAQSASEDNPMNVEVEESEDSEDEEASGDADDSRDSRDDQSPTGH